MAKATGNWIVVRDAQRMRIFEDCSHWDTMSFVGALSSDPRSWDELAIAWSRYHPTESWNDILWREIEQLPLAHHEDGEYLFMDLSQQIWAQPFESDDSVWKAGPYVSQAYPDRPVWINVPPWWQYQLIPSDSTLTATPPDASGVASRPVACFRDVLFGGEFLEYAADRMLAEGRALSADESTTAIANESKTAGARRSSRKRRRPVSQKTLRTQRKSVSAQETLRVIRRAHVDWLMTPRESLCGWTPRECLHWQRYWKDAELDFRRAQWSRERRPPPAVPVESHLFQSGPMGTEEVVGYFEFCRELLTMALRWVLMEPTQPRETLVCALMNHQQLLFDGPASEGAGLSLRETLKCDRQLLPMLASDEPADCDCPLCRLQASQTELFGPAFSICDGLHLEMEDEFAFSLFADREEWEMMRDPWLVDNSRPTLGDTSIPGKVRAKDAKKKKPKRNRHAARRAQARSIRDTQAGSASVLAAVEIRDSKVAPGKIVDPQAMNDKVMDSEADSLPDSVWERSHVSPTNDPRLSLFSIGARLAELIQLLKSKESSRVVIDRLNESFDDLSASTGNWLIGKSAGSSPSIETAVQGMIEILEEVTRLEPSLTGHSADLQSLVNQWQRLLLAR